MNDAPYRGFDTISYEASKSITNDRTAVETLVRIARRFMLEEAPRMAFAAGLLPNPHRAVDAKTVEEGLGELAHRILISGLLQASFVIFPGTLSGSRAKDFLAAVGPDGKHLVIAADGYENDVRHALGVHWAGELTLLTFAGTERDHQYEVYTGP